MPLYNGADEVLELYSGADQVMALYNGADSLLASPYALHTVSEIGYSGTTGSITPTSFRGIAISAIVWYGNFVISMAGAETPTLWNRFKLVNSSGTAVVDQPVTAFTFSYTSGYNEWSIAMGSSPFPNAAADWKVYIHE